MRKKEWIDEIESPEIWDSATIVDVERSEDDADAEVEMDRWEDDRSWSEKNEWRRLTAIDEEDELSSIALIPY